jgi:hypothetical protein
MKNTRKERNRMIDRWLSIHSAENRVAAMLTNYSEREGPGI